jgi:orotidine-5'-phosphate decarboxylase
MIRSNPICVALDTTDLVRARDLARALAAHVGYMKVGMEFFYAHGNKGYETVAAEGLPIFLDLKLHDIPNTVASGMKALMQLSPRPAIVNLHAQGGLDMMKAAAEAIDGRAKLIAVTILTSLSNQDIWSAGLNPAYETNAHATNLATLAKSAGLDGVVCSPHDLSGIRQTVGGAFLTVVPGIRSADAASDDQKRIGTPQAALVAGADILVIGRAITNSADPAQAAAKILSEISHGQG